MKNKDGVTLSEDFLSKFTNEIFTPLKNGQCVSCMFAAGGGKRTIFKYLLLEKNFIKKVFNSQGKKTLFIFVDPDEILNISNEAYLKLILDNLILKMNENKIDPINSSFVSNPLVLIKNNIEKLLKKNWRIVIILNDFEFTFNLPSSIYLNLESISNVGSTMADGTSKIVFLFLSTVNLYEENVLKSFQNLKHSIFQNIKFFPFFDKKESGFLIDKIAKKNNVKTTPEIKNILFEICGGHPQLLKYSVNLLSEARKQKISSENKIREFLSNHYQLKIICADVWNFLSDKEKNTIISIVNNGNYFDSKNENVEYLQNLSIIKKERGKFRMFSTVFDDFVKNKIPKHKLTLDPESKKLYYGGQNYEDKFSFQEFKLLSFFITHENELVSRDQVAEAIWGKFYIEKYSDWSIDKSVSIIRKKLDAIGFPSEYLKTLKKRGFSFSNPV